MSQKELFAVIVRVIGVLALIYIGRRVVLIHAWEWPMIARAISVIVAVYMIRGAPLLVNFAYPEKSGEGASTGT